MRVVVDKHVTRFPDAPEDTWRSAINEIVNLNFPAFGQEVLPKLAPDLDHADKDTMTLTLGALYRPLLAQAAEYGLCPSNLDVVNFHFGIIARIRPLPQPAEEIFADKRAWFVDVFIAGLQAEAGGADPDAISESDLVKPNCRE